MTAILKDLTIDEVSLVDEPANAAARVCLYKRADGEPEAVEKSLTCAKCGLKLSGPIPHDGKCVKCGTPYPEEDEEKKEAAAAPQKEDDMNEELTAQIEKLTADLATITTERDALKARVDAIDNAPEAVEKRAMAALPESVRKRLEDAETEVRKMREDRETAVAIAKAKEMGQPESFGPILKRLSCNQATSDDLAELERVLKAQKEQIEKGGLFSTIGRDGNESDMRDDDPRQEVVKRAHALMSKEPGLDFAGAQERLFRENPDLYEAYRVAVSAK